jgi:F-box-like
MSLGPHLSSLSMWQPADRAALPSLKDFKHAKKAISELEDALKDALVALEQAQLRVMALTKDISERKAWIAPIRMLPNELLSEIFIFASEMEHLAPVTITGVCHLWYQIVLATPQAWSLIYTAAPEHQKHLVQYVSTFVERSNPCLLHIWIPNDLDEDSDDLYYEPQKKVLPLLLPSLSRIRCLSIGSLELTTLTDETMPNLTRLRITDLAPDIPPFFINQSQFPRLQSIQSTGCPLGASPSPTWFPPLQSLAIQINHYSTWLDLVRNCAATLKVLSLVGDFQWPERVTIIFPLLEGLSFSNFSETPDAMEWSIKMVTPALVSYYEFAGSSTASSLHGDVKSVVNLRSSHVFDLAPFTNLRLLQLVPAYYTTHVVCARKITEQLTRDVNACPALQLIELYLSVLGEEDPYIESNKGITEEIRAARPGIEVVVTTESKHLPGLMDESPVSVLRSSLLAG